MIPTIYVKSDARVFIVEDNAERIKWFREKLGQRIIELTDDPDKAVKMLAALDPETLDAIFLDYDLGPGNMKNSTINAVPVVDYLNGRLTNRAQQSRIIIHSQNSPAAFWMNAMLPGAIRLPFGEFDIEDR